jgi:hypothetical protein
MLAAFPTAGTRTLLGWSFHPLSHALSYRARCTRLLVLFLGTFLMCSGDLYMTLTFAQSIGMIEVNPFARLIMRSHPVAVLIAWKLATVLFFGGVIFLGRRKLSAELASWICFGVMAALSVHWLEYSSSVSGFTSELASLAVSDDPRWVVLDDGPGHTLKHLSRMTVAAQAAMD